MSQARSVTATFTLPTFPLTVARAGNGTGTVTSTPAGINCGTTCVASFNSGQMVTLTPTPGPNSVFGSWAGACTGTGSCTVSMTSARTVQVNFDSAPRTLTVAKAGTGSGTVISAPAGISCGAACSGVFVHGQAIFLSGVPAPGSTFTGWSDPSCPGTASCLVVMNGDTTVTATFTIDRYPLSVSRAGTGSGSVSSTPAGISCGATCVASFDYDTMVTLTATPSTGSSFSNWSGYCTGTVPTCSVPLSQARNLTAHFTIDTFDLNVSTTGNGSVVPSPAGTTCGPGCSRHPYGTMVTLTPTNGTGSTFSSWSGSCTGAGACTVNMIAARSVVAAFSLNTYTVTVTSSGTGAGTIGSTPAGISCGATCNATFTYGTPLTLTFAPEPGVTFNGWSGGSCTGTNPCNFPVSGNVTINAESTRVQHQLVIAKPGDGAGVVTSVPPGITCGTTCTGLFSIGATVTLTAVASTIPESRDSTFIGWGGPCMGTGSCVVTMNAAQSVLANFKLKPNYAFVTSTKHDSNFGGLVGADAYCQTLANAAFLPGTFRAWVSTTTIDANARISMASGWVLPNGKPLGNLPSHISGRMWAPLRMTETGVELLPSFGSESVFTASVGGGYLNAGTCGDLTNTTGFIFAGDSAGQSDLAAFFGNLPCASQQRLYCLGIDRAATVVPQTTAVFRRAFVTDANWVPSGGLTTADALCQSTATTAGLPGTYKALLATTTASAGSRFSTIGPPWARVDQVAITSSASVMFTAPYWDTAPNLNAAGTVAFGNYGVWSGVPPGGNLFTTLGTVASTCNDWSPGVGATGEGGRAGHTRASIFTSQDSMPCTANNYALLCLQE